MPDSPILRPVISRPIDMGIVKRVLVEVKDQSSSVPGFPSDWSIWVEDGYLSTYINLAKKELKSFIINVQMATSCDLIDFKVRLPISPDDFLHFY